MAELVAATGVVALILWSGPSRSTSIRARTSPRTIGGLVAAATAMTVVFAPAHGVLVILGAVAAGGVGWLGARRARRREARQTSSAVQRICAELADDLAVGGVPEAAIVAAAERWPPLGPTAIAAAFHHDIPQALREVAALPGAAGLRDIGAAWQVSGQSGSGLAAALREVAGLLAARERQARLVDAELAAARATAMVVSALPLLVLGMGSGLGAHPWAFFVSGWGTSVVAVAGLLLFAGWTWLDRLTDQANR